MTQPLSWNLHGNDQLSGVLEKLDRVLEKLSRRLDGVSADAQQMGHALGNAEGKARSFGNETQAVEGRLDGLSAKATTAVGALGRYGAAAVAAFGLAAGAAVVWGVKMASANEQAQISFELLLGGARQAQAFLSKLQAFAAATPFEMPQLRDAASKLLAVGVNADRIIPLLTRLGDATSGMGTGAFGIERAVYALQQMSQAGKVSLEDINQLTDAGIPALDALSAKLGTTVAKLRQDISAGKIKPEQLFEAILDGEGTTFKKLDGMMKRQSASLAGIWSTFKDNAGQALAKFTEPALPGLKKLVDGAAAAVPVVLDQLQTMGGQVGDIFKGSDVPSKLTTSLKDLGEKILPVLKDAWDGIVGTIRDNKDGLEKLGRFITDFIIPAFGDGLVVSIRMVAGAFEGIIWVAARVVDAVNFLWVGFRSMLEMVLTQAEIAFGWIPGLGPKLKKAKQDFDTWADGITNKLNALDGRTVYIGVGFKAAERNATLGSVTNTNLNGRASGGPTWAGQVYTWNEHGTERFYSNTSGRIESARPGGGSQSGGDGEVIGVLKVVHVTPDGKVMHEELLTLKRGKGGKPLGLG